MAKDLKELLKSMPEEQRKNVNLHPDHKRPVTRRDFLAAGLLNFSGIMMMPSIINVLANSSVARADECPKGEAGPGRLPAFVTLNLSGGAALMANWVPRDAGNQPLPSYNQMGLGLNPTTEMVMNNAPFFTGSGFLAGLRARATQQTLDRTAFVGVCVRSGDDTDSNQMDISGMVAAAGLVGEKLPSMGRVNSETGINHRFALVRPPVPLIVGRIDDIRGALGAPMGALARIGEAEQIKMLDLISKLSDSQARRLASLSGGETLKTLVDCGHQKNMELLTNNTVSIDVRDNAGAAGVWGVNAQTGTNNRELVFGSMVYNALNGNAGAVGLEMGGYDYHGNNRTVTDQRDNEAGQTVGRILETAAVLNQKVFVFVCSDGSVSSQVSDTPSSFNSDRGSAGVLYMLAYDPAGRPATSGSQLGQFTTGQAADDRFLIGNSPSLAGAAVFANYLKFANRMDLLGKVLPNRFSAADLNLILKFA